MHGVEFSVYYIFRLSKDWHTEFGMVVHLLDSGLRRLKET